MFYPPRGMGTVRVLLALTPILSQRKRKLYREESLKSQSNSVCWKNRECFDHYN